MWEQLSIMTSQRSVFRITPAHVGTTNFALIVSKLNKDHPRSCGNNLFLAYSFLPSHRITPAHVGTTYSLSICHVLHRDHPRSCGNNRHHQSKFRNRNGSPPLMWEQPATLVAGRKLGLDHPRSCGNNYLSHASMNRILGSPPLMWEQPLTAHCATFQIRITPAHVGTTADFFPTQTERRDHPRSCGNNAFRYPIIKLY